VSSATAASPTALARREQVDYAHSVSKSDGYESIIARHYDALYDVMRTPSGDVAFYGALARASGGPVLELGCGTGRTLLPIAQAGIDCVGVDASPAMLDVFRAKSLPANLELVEAHMERLELPHRRFRLVTCPFRAFSHLLDVKSQLAALVTIRRHLEPGGLFALDVFDPKLARTALVEEPEHLAVTFHDAGREVRRWDTITRDMSRQVMTIYFRFESAAPELCGGGEVQMRWFYRFELEHLLARAGFTELQFFGGFDRRPWAAGGETIALARAGSADGQITPPASARGG
jgi:ubiquinone/menaquinone biosynthesis C-methylase UbiE